MKLRKGVKIGMLGLLCACAGVGSANMAVAYETATDNAKNYISTGEVSAELTETKYAGNNSPTVKTLLENAEVEKNPTVTNTGENDIVAFLVVTVPTKNVTPLDDNNTAGNTGWNEFIYMKDASDPVTSRANHFDENWTELPTKEDTDLTDGKRTYVFGYKNVLGAGESTSALFDKIQLRHLSRGDLAMDEAFNVDVEGYFIQGSLILDGNGKDLTKTLSEKNLNEIYDVYCNQKE